MGNPLTKIENTAKAGFLGYYVVGDSLASGDGVPSTVPLIVATVHTVVLGVAANTYLLDKGPMNYLPYAVIAGSELGLGVYEGFTSEKSAVTKAIEGADSGLAGAFMNGLGPNRNNPIPPGYKDATNDRKATIVETKKTLAKATAVQKETAAVVKKPLGPVQVAPANGKLTKDDLAYEQVQRKAFWGQASVARQTKTGYFTNPIPTAADKKRGDALWEAWKADFEKKRAANPATWDTVATTAMNRVRINKNSTNIDKVADVAKSNSKAIAEVARYEPFDRTTKCYINWGIGKTVSSGQGACDKAFGKGKTTYMQPITSHGCAAWEGAYQCRNWINQKTGAQVGKRPQIK